MTEDEMKVVSTFATEEAYRFFTSEAVSKTTEAFVSDELGVAHAGKVRLKSSLLLPTGTPITLSQTACSLLATGLAASFGENAPEERYDFETWEGSVAFSMALHISWDNLADRLLRKYAIDYVPSDVILPDADWEVLE
jgi:hypothetical protein